MVPPKADSLIARVSRSRSRHAPDGTNPANPYKVLWLERPQLRGRSLLKAKTILAGTVGLGLACAVSLTVLSTGAQSQTAPQALLTQSTWYWQGEVSGIPSTGGAPQTIPDPTVPSGDLAVGGPEQQGQATAETYLEFDVSAIPTGSTISSFKVSLPVDPSAQNLVPAGTVPPIVACAPEETWSGAPGPQPFGQKPSEHCDSSAPKVTSSDGGKTYTVDVASIAGEWVSTGQNFGVAITNDPSNTTTAYQVAFGPSSAIGNLQATVEYLPPATGGGLGASGGVIPSAVGTSGTESSAPAAPAIGASPSVLPVTSEPASAPAAAPAQAAPSVAPIGQPSRVTPTVIRPAAATNVPPAGFWVVGALLAVLIAACMIELSRSPESELTVSERGVGRMLSRLALREADGPPATGGSFEMRRSGNEGIA